MLLSRDWMGDYVELPEDTEDLAERLTAAGLAVDGTEAVGEDIVFEVDVTTNRPDAMNHLGMAREVAVLYDRPLKPPTVDSVDSSGAEQATESARLVVEDFEDCPRYDALVIRNVKVGPSPDWMVKRLEAIGSRSINNIVDITNYVLWETGQPLHAFDLERIDPDAEGTPELRVRRAREGEKLVTLDSETRELTPEILVIANAREAIALGGIMGGFDSEVTETTRHVLLEAAHFNPKVVRRGAKLLGMHTDASHRFERGADPEACLWAARRAAALMVEFGGGEILAGHLEEKALPSEWPPVVEVSHRKLVRFGGVEISVEEVSRTLTGLGFELEALPEKPGAGTSWRVRVPSWRYYDFENAYPADVYEEVLRIHGFHDLPATLPEIGGVDSPVRPEHTLASKLRDHLAASGFAEAINFGFHDRERDEAFPCLYAGLEPLALANPLSDRYAVMRRSLLPNLVASARYNQRRGADAVRLFEIGHVFAEGDGGKHSLVKGCLEQETLGLVLGGHLGTPWERETLFDFFDLKGVVESLAEACGLELEVRPARRPLLVEGATADLFLPDHSEPFGYLGELAETEGGLYSLFVAELATNALLRDEVDLSTQTPSRFPGISVDMTLTHSLEIPWVDLKRAVAEQNVEDLVHFGLKDLYRGKGVPQGAVNTTVYFLYNAEDRSLTHEEVNERHLRLAEELNRRFGFHGS